MDIIGLSGYVFGFLIALGFLWYLFAPKQKSKGL